MIDIVGLTKIVTKLDILLENKQYIQQMDSDLVKPLFAGDFYERIFTPNKGTCGNVRFYDMSHVYSAGLVKSGKIYHDIFLNHLNIEYSYTHNYPYNSDEKRMMYPVYGGEKAYDNDYFKANFWKNENRWNYVQWMRDKIKFAIDNYEAPQNELC